VGAKLGCEKADHSERRDMTNAIDKPPVLLVHGLIGSLRDVLPALEGCDVRAFAPDLIGYGEHSAVPPEHISLPAQVAYLLELLETHRLDRVHLVGHSVGGAIAVLFAHSHQERVAFIISVEGNFSLADAFWSAGVAQMAPFEVEQIMEEFRADLPAWLRRSGIEPAPEHLSTAERLLSNQPASTVQATAQSVVSITGDTTYEAAVRSVFESTLLVHLVAGERYRAARWAFDDVEDPQQFAKTVAALTS
jgi:pimeloyl-ACP methyl ester carboxylesterase